MPQGLPKAFQGPYKLNTGPQNPSSFSNQASINQTNPPPHTYARTRPDQIGIRPLVRACTRRHENRIENMTGKAG
jgi:hypothetical protein